MCHRGVEVDEDEVDVTEMMLKRSRIKPGNRIGIVVVKEGSSCSFPQHKTP